MKRELNQVIGAVMFAIGAIVFLVAGFMQVQSGSVPAAAFLIILLSIGCYFPELFQDGSNAPSTLRICVLMVVSVFAVMTVKVGWVFTDFSQFFVHESWIYILGLAFGAKLTQSFAELISGKLGKKGGPSTVAGTGVNAASTNVGNTNGASDNYATLHTERNALAGNPDDYDV